MEKREEVVTRILLHQSTGRLGVLMHELVASSLLRKNVLQDPANLSRLAALPSSRVYLLLYHELCIANLLEVLMDDGGALDSSAAPAEIWPAFLNWIVEAIQFLVSGDLHWDDEDFLHGARSTEGDSDIKSAKDFPTETAEHTVQRHIKEVRFASGICALTLFRYVMTACSGGRHPTLARLVLSNHQGLYLIRPLIENKPWRRVVSFNGQVKASEHFINGSWAVLRAVERNDVSVVEAQVWLAFWGMATSDWFGTNLTEADKAELITIGKRLITPAVTRDLTPLKDVKEHLVRLDVQSSLPGTGARERAFVIEDLSDMDVVDEMMETLKADVGAGQGAWMDHLTRALNELTANDDLRALGSLYGDAGFEDVASPDRCAVCSGTRGAGADGRLLTCGRCKAVKYCSVKCQKADWKKHKGTCRKPE